MSSNPLLLNFIFKDEDEAHFEELRQGDLLLKTAGLAEAIGQGHRHYADNPEYTHFLVLTQSCDLATRDGATCRADYLTLCAVKPLEVFLDRKLPGIFYSETDPLRIGRLGLQRSARHILDRLISNTHDEVFFLDAGCTRSLVERSCAFLQLSIALRREHFASVLRAEQAEMHDIFAAKLGWMTGNLYSRVGTPDLFEIHPSEAEQYVISFYKQILDAEEWLSEPIYKQYRSKLNLAKAAGEVSVEEARAILDGMPDAIDEFSDAIIDVLKKNGFETAADKLNKIRFRMANDQKLRRLIRAV